VFTAPLHSNGSYSIVAYVFVAARMCLPSRCVAMNVYSYFTIQGFGRHVTVFKHIWRLIPNREYEYTVNTEIEKTLEEDNNKEICVI
jgi:hypothetical protein